MKILFDEITVSSKTKNIDIFDGEKNIIINKKDFGRIKTIEGAIPISENCKDLNTLKIKSEINTYNVSFTEEQQNKVANVILEVPAMPFAELQSYNFDPNKKYRVYLNQDCMNNAGYDSPLPTFLKSKTNILEAVIDSDVTSIGECAFCDCSNLTSIIIPDSVTSIGSSAFQYCSGLTSINIPNGVTYISDYTFFGCRDLTSVTIGNGVTSIGECAFQSCSNLASVTIPDGVTSIGQDAFEGCDSLTSINVSSGNTTYNSLNGILYNKDKTTLVRYPEGKKDTTFDIPNSVTSIGAYAFQGCSNLISINIPNNVTFISDNAFYNFSSLTSATIPDSVTSIGDYTFFGCRDLTSVTIGNSVTSIGGYTFQNCSSLTSVTIPDGVTSIGQDAFEGCLKLTEITYTGTQVQWNAIQGLADACIQSGCIIHCTDGDITI